MNCRRSAITPAAARIAPIAVFSSFASHASSRISSATSSSRSAWPSAFRTSSSRESARATSQASCAFTRCLARCSALCRCSEAADTGSFAVRVLSVGSYPEDHLDLCKVVTGQEPPYCSDCRFEVVTADDVDGALRALEDAQIPIVLCDRELGKDDTWKTLLAGLAQL